ncbi:hypothetical protein KAFR_0G03270 [Kazachstania africana CBS 2517]|uniref:Cytochrome c oxidase subunit 9, mitochondrial n=1 Tax=Kazachstania africana (strain ATCC 22294 / BCRC 22015 / CBS 2517 / CECT 1963 / NBRC 1671 / NRRL Y-8276) TaxID=1071382 RepID=H2AYA9_KAZAF|nr:hypothetical protein KAFR_0G03270 [Kazachstania africana CBS 2517]CCF59359.1 hypothetical protein KAFR_0G03270 [Kazachstania africana CBS 2517]
MAIIAPITGTLKKRIITDIVIGFSLGGALASYWWWGFHKRIINKREDYYSQLATLKEQQEQE